MLTTLKFRSKKIYFFWYTKSLKFFSGRFRNSKMFFFFRNRFLYSKLKHFHSFVAENNKLRLGLFPSYFLSAFFVVNAIWNIFVTFFIVYIQNVQTEKISYMLLDYFCIYCLLFVFAPKVEDASVFEAM